MPEKVRREMLGHMKRTIEVLKSNLAKVQTGRANPAMIEDVQVDYYGTKTPLKQLATIAAPEVNLLVVQPYDKSQMETFEKAILAADLGLNPASDGHVIRVKVPKLSEERRAELTKVIKARGEEAKVALRNIRREANEKLDRTNTIAIGRRTTRRSASTRRGWTSWWRRRGVRSRRFSRSHPSGSDMPRVFLPSPFKLLRIGSGFSLCAGTAGILVGLGLPLAAAGVGIGFGLYAVNLFFLYETARGPSPRSGRGRDRIRTVCGEPLLPLRDGAGAPRAGRFGRGEVPRRCLGRRPSPLPRCRPERPPSLGDVEDSSFRK